MNYPQQTLSVEELMKPRIKMIAPAPFILNRPGEILKSWEMDNVFAFEIKRQGMGIHLLELSQVEQYPLIFKRLEWWEETEPEEMPSYVKTKVKVFKVLSHFVHHPLAYKGKAVWIHLQNATDIGFYLYTDVEPANEAEYQSFISNQSTHTQ